VVDRAGGLGARRAAFSRTKFSRSPQGRHHRPSLQGAGFTEDAAWWNGFGRAPKAPCSNHAHFSMKNESAFSVSPRAQPARGLSAGRTPHALGPPDPRPSGTHCSARNNRLGNTPLPSCRTDSSP
jgi:hypothetical protein